MPEKPVTQRDVVSAFIITVVIMILYFTVIGIKTTTIEQAVQRIEQRCTQEADR